MNNLTLGSLFDGSGGFPLGGLLTGITPVWASEIEPFPIMVTKKRLPFMKHYGDISQMDGGEVEPVDIITFGSPCQDMSVAGKREGLDGNRSGLFYEAVRIIKEMRCKTDGKYPRYIVWENVPGAFSSNKGEDFRCVLESICRIKDETVSIPKSDKWQSAGSIVGADYSVCWRVLDAQYFGVPQRRKRIYLVADFTDRSAAKILFESEGLSGYSAESFRSWQRTACRTQGCTSASGFDGYNGKLTDDVASTLGVNCGMSTGRNGVVLNDQGGNRMDVTNGVVCTLRAESRHPPCVMDAGGFCTEHSAKAHGIGYQEETSPTLRAGTVPAAVALENHPADGRIKVEETGTVQTLTERMGTGGNNVPLVMKIRSGCEGGGKGPLVQTDKSATLSCNNDQTLFEPCSWDGGQISPTLTKQNAGGSQRMPDKDNFNCVLQPFGICSKDSNAMKSSNPNSGVYEADISRTIDTSGGNPSCNQGGIAVVCIDQGGGKNSVNISKKISPMLAATHGGEPVIAFTQNQRDEVRTLGEASAAVCANAGTKQQTYVMQGSMIGRKNGNGPQGDGISEDVSFTLNTVDRHAVYSMTTGSFPNVAEEKTPPLLARDFKDATVITDPSFGIGRDAFNQGSNAQYKPCIEEEVQPTIVAKGLGAVAQNESGYTVRRLTPTECARLQGFPDWWCDDLGIEHPTSEDVYEWYKIFETHRKITGSSSKPKTEKQIRAFLQDPHSDSAEYKMWGNGVALPCVYFVLSGIVWAHSKNS